MQSSIRKLETNIDAPPLFRPRMIFDYSILDIETTGLDPEVDDILEICVLRQMVSNNTYDIFHSYINTDKLISPDISAINGITNDILIDKPNKNEILPLIRQFINNTVLIGHNILFDISFLNQHSNNMFKNNIYYIDTLEMAQTLLKNKLINFSQSSLEDYFGIINKKRHSANGDVCALYEIFKKLDEISSVMLYIRKHRT